MTHYSLLIGSSGVSLPATSFVELTSGSGTFSVPTGYNAIHIQAGVGGGGGGSSGLDYDKARCRTRRWRRRFFWLTYPIKFFQSQEVKQFHIQCRIRGWWTAQV
jgi:hypothetical protein